MRTDPRCSIEPDAVAPRLLSHSPVSLLKPSCVLSHTASGDKALCDWGLTRRMSLEPESCSAALSLALCAVRELEMVRSAITGLTRLRQLPRFGSAPKIVLIIRGLLSPKSGSTRREISFQKTCIRFLDWGL